MILDPADIVVGNQYHIAEYPYYEAIVTVMADESGEDLANRHSANWVGWNLRVDEILDGGGLTVGQEFSVGWDSEVPQYSCVKFYNKG